MRLYLCSLISILCCVEGYYVNISHDGPVITGGAISLIATLYDDDGNTPSGKFKFFWQDNAIPPHKAEFEGKDMTKSAWSVSYPADIYPPGPYEVQVIVERVIIPFPWKIIRQSTVFNITSFLNGDIQLIQNGTVIKNNYVSNSKKVLHRVSLLPADLNFINVSSNLIQSYWFIDYAYVGSTIGLEFSYNYSKYLNKNINVKALVIVSKANTSIANETVPSNLTNEITTQKPSTTQPYPVELHDFNINASCIPSDPNKTYGCFQHDIFVRGEVTNVHVSGNYWLKHGEMLNMSVTCSGSGPFWHCVKILSGEYNASGQETCMKATQTQNCSVKVLHYFSIPSEYTLLFIIGNAVTRTVTPVRVTIYQVQKHAELSVIVVPITCSVVAVILIVFGVAYYIQSRNRYIIEVADFDFAQPSCETEYKTLGERLRDAVSGAINRTQDYVEDSGGGGGSVWSPSRKYGSMQ